MEDLLKKRGMIFGWLFSLDSGWYFVLFFIRAIKETIPSIVRVLFTNISLKNPEMFWSGFT